MGPERHMHTVWLNLKMISITTSETVFMLATHIKNGKPICLHRMGDGELYILRSAKGNIKQGWGIFKRALRLSGLGNPKAPDPREDLDRWLHMNQAGIETYRANILQGVQGADILAVGKIYDGRPLRSTTIAGWDSDPEELESLGINTTNKYWCPFTVTRSRELGTVDGVRKLLDGTPVHIINRHTEKLKKNGVAKLLGTAVGYTTYPARGTMKARADILAKLPYITEPVVLTATGGFGKIINNILRDMGKIVIDMGSSLECWTGIIPRACFAPGGIHDYCVPPKTYD